MEETHVRLLCPSCQKDWQVRPDSLPAPDAQFECPDCDTTRTTAEFTRTEHDLRALKRLG